MSSANASSGETFRWLERATALLLVLVLAALAWVVLAAYQPDWAGPAASELSIVIVLLLLIAAVGLVSLVALLHTRT